MKEGQTQEPVGGMLEIAKTILLSIDHYREAGRDDSFNVQSIADYLKRCFSAPPSPVGIDVEALAKKLYPNIMINECTGPIDFDKRNVAQKALRNAFKAGYSASLPQSSRINQLESGIKQFLLWLKEKRPSMTGHGAPIMILQDLLDSKTNDLIKSSYSSEDMDIIASQSFEAGKSSKPSPQSSTEEEKERKVILLASYCGDNPNCTEDLPCEECLKMCNIAIIKDRDIKNVIAGYDFMRDTASLPSSSVTGESEAGERKFTLKEIREAFCHTYNVGKAFPGNNKNKDEKQYFKQTFGIDI